MPKRVSMKGRGPEAVYGAYEAAPVRRNAGVDAYPRGPYRRRVATAGRSTREGLKKERR